MPPLQPPDQFFEAKATEYPFVSAPHGLAARLACGDLSAEEAMKFIANFGLHNDRSFRGILLDWILDYIRQALASRPLAAEVADAVEPMKHVLGIREGDFYNFRPLEIKAILCGQLDLILEDGVLEDHEELAQASLQRAFDLGYDQYLALTRPRYEIALQEIRAALLNAKPSEIPRLERQHLS